MAMDPELFEDIIRSHILVFLYNRTRLMDILRWQAALNNSFVTSDGGMTFELSERFDYEADCCKDRHIEVSLSNVHGKTTFDICSNDTSFEANRTRMLFDGLKSHVKYKSSTAPSGVNCVLWHAYQMLKK